MRARPNKNTPAVIQSLATVLYSRGMSKTHAAFLLLVTPRSSSSFSTASARAIINNFWRELYYETQPFRFMPGLYFSCRL